MEIIKLGDILNENPVYGANLPGLKNGKYKYFTQSDIKSGSPSKFVNFTKNRIMEKDDFFLSRAGTIEPYLHIKEEKWVFAGYLVKYPLNKKICIPKFIYYWFCGPGKNNLIKNSNTGSTMPKMNPNVAKSLKIILPSIQIQKSIINIIEPLEKQITLFLSLQKRIKNFISRLNIKETKVKDIFMEIKTGKHNTNVTKKDGKYNFYTAGKEILKSDKSTFNGRYILLSGNGHLFSWYYEGVFDVYQRVYVLKEKSDFYTTYYSVEKNLEFLRNRSNGAVIKFIKLNDIKEIKKYENTHEKILEILYQFIAKLERKIQLLKQIKEKQIQLLVQ